MSDPVSRWGAKNPAMFSAYVGGLVAVIASGLTVVVLDRLPALARLFGTGPMAGVVFVLVMALLGSAFGVLLLRPVLEGLAAERDRWRRIALDGTETAAHAPAGEVPGAEPATPRHAEGVPEDGQVHRVPGGVEIYQSTLMHIWEDGLVTEKEERTLADLRRRLGVSDRQHEHLEEEVKDVLFDGEPPTA